MPPAPTPSPTASLPAVAPRLAWSREGVLPADEDLAAWLRAHLPASQPVVLVANKAEGAKAREGEDGRPPARPARTHARLRTACRTACPAGVLSCVRYCQRAG